KPAADQLELTSVLFANIRTPRFATQFFILVFFISLFALSKLTPRFWCRYLCPAGGILSLFSRKPVFRRQVSLDCDSCNRCVRACAMGAIDEDNPLITKHEECTVCLTCKKVCPSNSVTFGTGRQKIAHAPAKDRRRFLIASVTGAGTAAVCLTGLNAPSNTIVNGQISTEKLLRPPAALPENEFLSMCVRCGECMIACPTNTLQPLWFQAGLIGLFSPVITPRRSFCDPDCHRCAAVCPTNSIRVISKEERMWAKTGTAVILKHKCLAWEQQQKCMVCDETCPFNAVVFDKEPGNPVPVPKVLEEKCTGCGYCEYHCPVQNESAIIISPMGELRLEKGSYKKEGQLRGLKISTKKIESDYSSTPEVESGNQAPGFTE
ncbi:4Fe-4S binding protein, partial [bacterium]|nr:4Fe-4S binding protein [bacterium]